MAADARQPPEPGPAPVKKTARRSRKTAGAPAAGSRLTEGDGEAETGMARPSDTGFEQWLQQARGQGLGTAELVWELHIAQGRSLAETARLLSLSTAQAAAHHAEMRSRAVEAAPREEADFIAVREELRVRLMAILEDACRTPGDARLLSVRQRVCDQLADLYGLKSQRRTPAAAEEEAAPAAYALPPELGDAVQSLVNNLYGRAADITAARRHFGSLPEGEDEEGGA